MASLVPGHDDGQVPGGILPDAVRLVLQDILVPGIVVPDEEALGVEVPSVLLRHRFVRGGGILVGLLLKVSILLRQGQAGKQKQEHQEQGSQSFHRFHAFFFFRI